MSKIFSNKVIWMTGHSGAGKSTLAYELMGRLKIAGGIPAIILDGDTIRYYLTPDLGYDKTDRLKNTITMARIAKMLSVQGFMVIVATMSPTELQRQTAKDILGEEYKLLYVQANIDKCVQMDSKGLYAKHGTESMLGGFEEPDESAIWMTVNPLKEGLCESVCGIFQKLETDSYQ